MELSENARIRVRVEALPDDGEGEGATVFPPRTQSSSVWGYDIVAPALGDSLRHVGASRVGENTSIGLAVAGGSTAAQVERVEGAAETGLEERRVTGASPHGAEREVAEGEAAQHGRGAPVDNNHNMPLQPNPEGFGCTTWAGVTEFLGIMAKALNHCDDGVDYVHDEEESLATTIDTVYSNLIY